METVSRILDATKRRLIREVGGGGCGGARSPSFSLTNEGQVDRRTDCRRDGAVRIKSKHAILLLMEERRLEIGTGRNILCKVAFEVGYFT